MPRFFALANPVLAALWLALYFGLAPSRSLALNVAFAAAALLFALGGVGWWRGGRAGRALALLGASAALAWVLVLLAGLASAAAYLHGIYGALGRAASVIAAVAGVVLATLVGLLPAVEIAVLMRRRDG
ncbi:MAG: hypothetical protein AABZ30_03225 [Myxococcota bacterium]